MADFNILGNLLRDIGAPILGMVIKEVVPGTLGDIGGGLAGGLIKGLADKLGADPTPEAVAEAIQKDPAAGAVAAKEVEREQADAIAKLMEEQVKAQVDARATTVELVKQGSLIAWGPSIYAASVVGMFGACLFTLLFQPVHISDAAGGILTMLLGVLTREMGAVGGYFLGSTQSSKDKDATIGALSQQPASTAKTVGAAIGNAVGKAVRPKR